MFTLRVASILYLLGASFAQDGAPCTAEGEVELTEECEHVYKCSLHEGTLTWKGLLCSDGEKPNPTATGCEEGKCLPGTVTPAPETSTTDKPLEFDCEANMPRENDVGFATDTNDCSKYYYCMRNDDRSWSFHNLECHKDHHFYPSIRQCVRGGCPKDVLPSVPPRPGERFYCQDYVPPGYTGNVPDPNNCRWYFHCHYGHNRRWKITHYHCPQGLHYNVIDAGCVHGPCS